MVNTVPEKKEWSWEELISLQQAVLEEHSHSQELSTDEAEIYKLQDEISSLNEQRNVRALELSNLDRKINFLVLSRLQKASKKGENDTFVFFDQSARQDNPLGDHKSDYSSFLYLLRVEPTYLAKAVMEIPYADMDYMVQCLSFSLFPDLFQAREELYLLDLIKHIINNQVDLALEPTDVLRQNSFVTKLLGGYAKRHFGQVHLVLCLKDAVVDFINEASKSLTAFDMNPDSVYKIIAGKAYDNTKSKEEILAMPEVQEQLAISHQKLEEFSARVLDGIVQNLSSMPYGIRYLCKQMLLSATKKFELSEKQVYLMLSSFLILRYFNPALLCPDVFGIIDREVSANVRRPLVMLSKVIQNYANDAMFGGKEAFMQPFNDTRQKGIDVLKAYCKKIIEVPEPQEYYATVANLPTRKDGARDLIFHNTCVTISPNQLFTIHRLIDSTKEKILPKFHPISFFLGRLGQAPPNVERKDDKIFTMPLSGGDDEEVDDETKNELAIRNLCENVADTFAHVKFPEGTNITSSQDLIPHLENLLGETTQDSIKKKVSEILATLKGKKGPNMNVLFELEKFNAYKISYRQSLKKEKEEMVNSLVILKKGAQENHEKEIMYKDYLENIIKGAYIAKLMSKKEYQEAMKIGPLEYSCSNLEKLNLFTNAKEIESSQKKHTVFHFTCTEPGKVEIAITNTVYKETKAVTVGISALLDLLTQQDTAKIHGFIFDLRALVGFLNSEIAG